MLDTPYILIYDKFMHRFNGRKIFLFGFIAVLLIGIPATIFLVQQQQETRSRAEKSTTLSFAPDSTPTTPIQKNVGDSIPLDIFVDPGTNLVSFVKLEIQYDPEKIATDAAQALVPDPAVFPSVLEGPVYTPGKISVTLSVGPDPTKAVQTRTKAATVNFKALSTTPPGTPTVVTYGVSTQALSIGFNDQASENVLSSTTPANIAIGGEGPSPTSPPPTNPPTLTPTVSVTPTTRPSVSLTPTISSTPSANKLPLCSSLIASSSPAGPVPLALSFTAAGSDPDGTIAKVTFNFGDGGVIDVTDPATGVGTASVSAQASYTYNTAGTFTASAVITDNQNGLSTANSCVQTVTVTGDSTTIAPTEAPTAVPSLPPTGATETAMAIGGLLLAVIIAGGLLFILL
jgi:hypothetical protein